MLLTANLVPGDWVALNIYFDGGEIPQFAFDQFTVVDEGNDAPAPEEDGTIVLGPGMRIDVDGEFDASGVWKVENHDEDQMHEPALVGLTGDATGEDLIAALADPQGPPPIARRVRRHGRHEPRQRGMGDVRGPARARQLRARVLGARRERRAAPHGRHVPGLLRRLTALPRESAGAGTTVRVVPAPSVRAFGPQ